MRLELQATPKEVMRAVATLEEFARAQQIPEEFIFGLALALEECASNIVNHAFQGDSRRRFQASFDRIGGSFVIELRDRGPEFDPTTVSPRQRSVAQDDQPGGLGIPLARHYLDEIRYRREAGENVLRLHKQLVSATGAE